jgi:hypothetical protein
LTTVSKIVGRKEEEWGDESIRKFVNSQAGSGDSCDVADKRQDGGQKRGKIFGGMER